VQTILPLSNNAGLKLTTARYYTPSGRSIQAKGIEPDIYVDDGRESPNRIREANLENHLGTGRAEAAASKAVEALKKNDGDAEKARTTASGAGAAARFEFGSAEDFQLTQAMNQLKGQPVIASARAVSAQAKPQ
jgi:carboxyl-terminal processing protease